MLSSWREAAANAASKIKAASETAAEAVTSIKRSIEDELASEYEKTQASSVPASSSSLVPPPPPPPSASAVPSTAAAIASVGVALLSPLDDTTGRAGGKSDAPDRVVMLPWEVPGLNEPTRQRMRGLSQERSIFLAPPAGGHASFRFDLEASLPLILEALSVDPHLESQRGLLVPQQVRVCCACAAVLFSRALSLSSLSCVFLGARVCVCVTHLVR